MECEARGSREEEEEEEGEVSGESPPLPVDGNGPPWERE
jgi:hypothetical protein